MAFCRFALFETTPLDKNGKLARETSLQQFYLKRIIAEYATETILIWKSQIYYCNIYRG